MMNTFTEYVTKHAGKAAREDKITAVLALQGLNKSRLARKMGVTPGFIDQLFNGRVKTPSRREQLVNEFNIPPELLP